MSLRQMPYGRLAMAAISTASFAVGAGAQFKKDLPQTDLPQKDLPPPIPCEDIDSVGTAKMAADGTITIQLRSLWPDPVAEAQLVYAPDDPQYDEIKHHIGGIAAGEAKPVPPWCGLNSEP
jgi:hypothetical protein